MVELVKQVHLQKEVGAVDVEYWIDAAYVLGTYKLPELMIGICISAMHISMRFLRPWCCEYLCRFRHGIDAESHGLSWDIFEASTRWDEISQSKVI